MASFFAACIAVIILLLFCSFAHADTKHVVLVCHTEQAYNDMVQGIKDQIAISAIDSTAMSHKIFVQVTEANGCVDIHAGFGIPPFQIIDRDPPFVIISNGTTTGYMNQNDYDRMYLIGLPDAGH